MTKEEFKQLESLMGKLHLFLGSRYSVTPFHLGELCHIATFDRDGNLIHQSAGISIEDSALQLRRKS